MDDSSDLELWAAAAEGDETSFGALFVRHGPAIYNFCGRRTADWLLAEDLTSMVFLEAWRRRSEVEMTRDSALPWLYGVALNVLRNHRRADRRQQEMLLRSVVPTDRPDFSDDVVGRIDDERRMRRVLSVVARLPEIEQEVLALCIWEGLSYEQAAIALNIPVGTVRSRLFRARVHLRELSTRGGHERDDVPSANERTRERAHE